MKRIEIKKILIDKGISQAKMAKDLNIHPQRICDMLSGRLPGWKYRRRISQYLGIPEEVLFPDDGNKSSA
jgi:transcriptional regulator with XRE-family HTH domain